MAILSTKGQIVIPEEIRAALELKPGADIAVEMLENSILLIPRPKDPLKALRGATKGWFEEDAVTMVRRMRDEDIKKDKKKPWLA
jgi:AbrB family looped-hinge helix DNA binding protein